MNRYLTLLGIILAALLILFHFVGLAAGLEVVLLAISIILVGVGTLTGL